MKKIIVKITLRVEVNTDEPKSVIEDRFKCVDFNSLASYDLECSLDELGEVENVELEDVVAE